MTWKIRKVTFKGQVQGVGFRAAVQREARRLSVRGWVENQPDGSVDAFFFEDVSAGEERILELLRKIASGVGAARLTHLEVIEAEWMPSENRADLKLEGGVFEFGPGQSDFKADLEGCGEDFIIRT